MVSLEKRIKALSVLGNYMSQLFNSWPNVDCLEEKLIQQQHETNAWHITPSVLSAIGYWSKKLTIGELELWVNKYPKLIDTDADQNVAMIPSENAPLAGFHDFISIVIGGQHFYCRNINKGQDLLQHLTLKLTNFEPSLKDYVHWVETFPKNMDSYLMSNVAENNQAALQYFTKKHSLIRNKRVSIAVVTNNDSNNDLKLLGKDIFDFFGMDSHNVRKVFLPQGYEIPRFLDAMQDFSYVYQYNRYANNYDYHRSVLLMEQVPFFDNGFLVFRENADCFAPIGCLYYEFYSSINDLETKIAACSNHVQQIMANSNFTFSTVKFGYSQDYPLSDFNDKKDVMEFLIS